MNSQPETFPSCSQQERIQDYLDHLCAPLVGVMPYSQRAEVRMETESHLYALTEDYTRQGLSDVEAVEAALRAYGQPYSLGQTLVDTWYRGKGSKTHPSRYLHFVAVRAFACFSTLSALSYLFTGIYVLWDGAVINLTWLVSFLFICPIIAGVSIGLLVATRGVQAVSVAMIPLLVHGVLTGLLFLPRVEGLYLALFQLLYWLPVGALTAALTQLYHTYCRRRTFRVLSTH